MPDLQFHVDHAEMLAFAATPSLCFKLRIENEAMEPIQSILLNLQIRIPVAQRHYSSQEQGQLYELFGAAHRWGETLKAMHWTNVVLLVPAFTESTVIDVPVPCTYDFGVVTAKYFHALQDGEVPLEFLFSGTVFYTGEFGLQAVKVPWDKEAGFRMKVEVWQAMMDHYFPNSTWLRLRKDLFDRLYAYKVHQGLLSWEEALEQLLSANQERVVQP